MLSRRNAFKARRNQRNAMRSAEKNPYHCPVNWRRFICLFVLLAALAWYGVPATYAQCPMCKTAITKARDGGETKVGSTLNAGIMYLFAFHYAIAGTIGFIYWRASRQRKAAEKYDGD